ncbi:hypothetical protein [Paenibacillus silvisoli]|uniref:hypothetical protein n=1 Tax=Paenibacillus silvisoli TaxID=3110539 RepID=UPI002805618F|nr:hypothetical protein [Paenibacillus silvisoli]
MLTLEELDLTMKQSQKDQRLASIKSQWFEHYMNKVAYEANNIPQGAAASQKKMDELQTSYEAIEAIVVE